MVTLHNAGIDSLCYHNTVYHRSSSFKNYARQKLGIRFFWEYSALFFQFSVVYAVYSGGWTLSSFLGGQIASKYLLFIYNRAEELSTYRYCIL